MINNIDGKKSTFLQRVKLSTMGLTSGVKQKAASASAVASMVRTDAIKPVANAGKRVANKASKSAHSFAQGLGSIVSKAKSSYGQLKQGTSQVKTKVGARLDEYKAASVQQAAVVRGQKHVDEVDIRYQLAAKKIIELYSYLQKRYIKKHKETTRNTSRNVNADTRSRAKVAAYRQLKMYVDSMMNEIELIVSKERAQNVNKLQGKENVNRLFNSFKMKKGVIQVPEIDFSVDNSAMIINKKQFNSSTKF